LADEMINQFDIQMRRGLTSFLVLSILRENSYHGYKIIEEINKRTHGFWSPPSSTIYPLLRKLKEKGLINQIEDNDTDSTKKIYKLTKEGQSALDMMAEKRNERQNQIIKFISSTLKNLPDDRKGNILEELMPFPSMGSPKSFGEGLIHLLEDLPNDEEIRLLEMIKKKFLKEIELIEKRLEKLRE